MVQRSGTAEDVYKEISIRFQLPVLEKLDTVANSLYGGNRSQAVNAMLRKHLNVQTLQQCPACGGRLYYGKKAMYCRSMQCGKVLAYE